MECQPSFFTLSKLTDGMGWMTMMTSAKTSGCPLILILKGGSSKCLIFFLSRNANMKEYCRWTTISIAGWHSGMTGWSSEMTGWHFGMTGWHSGMTGWHSEMVGWHFGMKWIKWWSSGMTGWHWIWFHTFLYMITQLSDKSLNKNFLYYCMTVIHDILIWNNMLIYLANQGTDKQIVSPLSPFGTLLAHRQWLYTLINLDPFSLWHTGGPHVVALHSQI